MVFNMRKQGLFFLILFLETVELFYPTQPEADIQPRKFQPNISGVWKSYKEQNRCLILQSNCKAIRGIDVPSKMLPPRSFMRGQKYKQFVAFMAKGVV